MKQEAGREKCNVKEVKKEEKVLCDVGKEGRKKEHGENTWKKKEARTNRGNRQERKNLIIRR